MEYPIQTSTRRCSATGRQLAEGEAYFSALVDGPEGLARLDYSEEGWPGAPADALAFWKGTVPRGDQRRRTLFDPDVLLNLFVRLEQHADGGKEPIRYFLALLLLRKRILKFLDAERSGPAEVWVLHSNRTETTHRVVNPHLSDEQLAEVEEELGRLLEMEV